MKVLETSSWKLVTTEPCGRGTISWVGMIIAEGAYLHLGQKVVS